MTVTFLAGTVFGDVAPRNVNDTSNKTFEYGVVLCSTF